MSCVSPLSRGRVDRILSLGEAYDDIESSAVFSGSCNRRARLHVVACLVCAGLQGPKIRMVKKGLLHERVLEPHGEPGSMVVPLGA